MNCKQCGDELINMREDAIFCTTLCKQKHYKRRKKIENEIKKLQRSISMELEIIKHWKVVFNEEKNRLIRGIETLNQTIDKKTKHKNFLLQRIKLNKEDFLDMLFDYFERYPDRFYREIEIMYSESLRDIFRVLNRYREFYKKRASKLADEIFELKNQLEVLRNAERFNMLSDNQKKAKAVIKKSAQELVEFRKKLEELEQIDTDRLPIVPSRKSINKQPKRGSSARAYSGSEIANLNFNGVQLENDLGKFLGNLERNKCAIALTGDSGAGKTYFSYTLADGFLDKNLSVGYFSLESGFTAKFKQFAKKYAGNRSFKAFEEGKLKDVRTEASNFDCLIIDSYSKISQRAIDFEELRQDFPDTYFVIIFQKTTDGKIRGGSSILFNSTATIDIQINKKTGERIAVMKKSRYDTENFIYSISDKSLIKADKLPI